MLKITNLTTGETISLERDAAHDHPEWVHAQCGTSSEAELQDMLSQAGTGYLDNAGKADSAGILMTEEDAVAHYDETLVGQQVEGGTGDDYDTGRVESVIDSRTVLVAWYSLVKTPAGISALRLI